MSIEINALTKIYGQQKAVDHISFSVKKGEIVGFLGPNGAGKSTTMKMVTGYLKPDAGSVTVCGIDVMAHALEAKKKIGYLPEANPLYYDMFVREYLQFIASVHHVADVNNRVKEVIALTGLTIECNKKVGQLSKGYKQRVGLAASLIHHPDVLILDEPTSGLDPNQIVEIRNVIKQQGEDKTVLFSSHILQEVQAICNRIIIINKGVIVADDTLHNLQQRNTANRVRVSFKETIADTLLVSLAASNIVRRIDAYTWSIQTNEVSELRKQILELAIHENLNIASLQTEGNDLEEIFQTLTKSSPVL